MRIILWIVRILAILLLIRMIAAALLGRRRRASTPGGQGSPPRPAERLGGELVQDPNCGTYIPKARAIAAGAGDDVQYFCSTECRDKYAAR